VSIKATRKGVLVPEELFKEMIGIFTRIEQILAILETLADEDALEIIKRSREEIAKGRYVECSIEDLERILR
jgi:DNA-binding transcriptional ArsR family regulator